MTRTPYAPEALAPRSMAGVYYGWIVLLVAALAMVGTLPGRTQGLGLVTEPPLAGPAGYSPRPTFTSNRLRGKPSCVRTTSPIIVR